ncbi:MAG: stage IV sporulation protein A [Lachnospiraceae bacterium]|nr:stage IV sporulation protein A [Lachnospiraceae bacterium]
MDAKEFNLYNDIQKRTNGEIFIGVVGPVRTGKSTFIKRFMEQMVLPMMQEDYVKELTKDELPQSAGGKTVTTTEPKFIPKEAAKIELAEDLSMKVRLIDCVGYMVDGASGHMEEDAERMVKTPWFDYEIPFTKAAEVGTKKVITDHSTIGIVVTTDGSFGELRRPVYEPAEETTVKQLKALGKPFIILLNSVRPYSDETKAFAGELSKRYGASCVPVNCEQLKKEDIIRIFQEILYEFPVAVMEYYMPKWVEMLSIEHPVKKEMIEKLKERMTAISKIRDVFYDESKLEGDYINDSRLNELDLSNGTVKYRIYVDDSYYYQMLSELLGETIQSEYQLLNSLNELSKLKAEYSKVIDAMRDVRGKGYGVVMPERDEIILEKPEVIRHGNKYGVKIKAECPSIHMIRANIQTEIAPIVGTKEQADDLIEYIAKTNNENGMWETNIFGKTVEQLVRDGITSKINMLNEESQTKLQDTMQKIVNDSNGGMICIII